ncbi:MAG: CDP-alcohol phosphatidyltransferase family protein [Candidatus Margulisbacteria bacterium]|nr:CDP-alcohol phosphatidyltransferase family protein [Candidatus Margulisiibacteriota bacterium]MBU1729888.1 CDP-alcohol phosphatidyltransferase family protein [Candidatus Margulisiibacteriota bacterium]
MGNYKYKTFKKSVVKEPCFYFQILSSLFAAPMAFISHKIGFTANQLTMSGIFLLFPALFFNLNAHYVAAIIVFHLFYLIDAADGVLARATRTTSLLGSYLDDLSHYLFHPIFFLSFAFSVYYDGYVELSFFVALFALADILFRANLDLIYDKYAINQEGLTFKTFPSSGRVPIDERLRIFFISSFTLPNVLVVMTVLFWNFKLLAIYFAYAAICSLGLYIYSVIRAVRKGFE